MLPGTYNGEITVTAPGAASSPKTVPVMLTIRPGNPQPAQANPGGPYHAQLLPEVELDGSASIDPAGTIASYLWTFDDSTTAVGARVKHVYATPGHHPVSLTIARFSGPHGQSSATEVVCQLPRRDPHDRAYAAS
jgi:hypothetical protein